MIAIDRQQRKVILYIEYLYKEVMMFGLLISVIIASSQAGTFSIVAHDPETDEWGIAVASKVLDVGYIVPWIEPGIGAVATQAYTNVYFGPWALDLLRAGLSAEEVLDSIIARDTMPEQRQVGIIDKDGHAAAYTGTMTSKWAGHYTDKHVSIQGNILVGKQVIDSMLVAYKRTSGPLSQRLLAALIAGELAGGDSRGKQSAALYVMKKRGGYEGVDDRLVDLKVVDNPEAVKELERLYTKWQYVFLAPAYLRFSREDTVRAEVYLARTYSLLVTALSSEFDDADIYNTLAWEFALKKIYPEKTLQAAKKAHELDPNADYIMDTLAEAYFAMGRYDEAIHWEKEALKKSPDDEFFKGQLEKFKKALQKQKK
jgi:uncharacterized Ntn-hydrolase superfamily protein